MKHITQLSNCADGPQVRVLVVGTALTFACKPMFALLGSVNAAFGAVIALYWYFAAKLMDRLSKGIREAPTKAIINELARESGDAPDAAYGACSYDDELACLTAGL